MVRARGRPLSRRHVVNQVPRYGDVGVEYLRDEVRLRYLRVARLVDVAAPMRGDLLPMLYDATLIAMNPAAFTLSGFERLEGADYAQTWLVTPVIGPMG